jgi:hypothetical protein
MTSSSNLHPPCAFVLHISLSIVLWYGNVYRMWSPQVAAFHVTRGNPSPLATTCPHNSAFSSVSSPLPAPPQMHTGP